jgi:hypothetical protein
VGWVTWQWTTETEPIHTFDRVTGRHRSWPWPTSVKVWRPTDKPGRVLVRSGSDACAIHAVELDTGTIVVTYVADSSVQWFRAFENTVITCSPASRDIDNITVFDGDGAVYDVVTYRKANTIGYRFVVKFEPTTNDIPENVFHAFIGEHEGCDVYGLHEGATCKIEVVVGVAPSCRPVRWHWIEAAVTASSAEHPAAPTPLRQ